MIEKKQSLDVWLEYGARFSIAVIGFMIAIMGKATIDEGLYMFTKYSENSLVFQGVRSIVVGLLFTVLGIFLIAAAVLAFRGSKTNGKLE